MTPPLIEACLSPFMFYATQGLGDAHYSRAGCVRQAGREGIAGQRESYQPIQSQLTSDSDAASIAQAFRDVFGLTEFYVADLDGIERGANFETLQTLQQSQAKLWLDVGTNSRASLQQLAQHIPLNSVHRIIVGLEGCPDLSVLESIQSMVSRTSWHLVWI